jgi:DNA-binding transcriptional ArsR family regulator
MNRTLRQFKAQIFQGLAHPTRIAIVDALRNGEISAGTLVERLSLEQANASQHLAVLRAKQIVVNRKVGNQVYYSLRDPVLIEVLDLLRRYFSSHLTETRGLLEEMEAVELEPAPTPTRKAGSHS